MLTISPDKQNIYIMGFMGCGKTTVGAFLAEKLNRPFIDTDTIIQEKTGLAISDIFKKYGETDFRTIEKDVVSEVSKLAGCIIALGGGAVLLSENWENISSTGFTVALSFSPEIISFRLKKDTKRPLLNNNSKNRLKNIKDIMGKRIPLYKKADLYLHYEKTLSPDMIADTIISHLNAKNWLNKNEKN